MIDSAAGETIAAPRPCAARAAMQPSLRLRESARERGEREQHEADHEHPPASEQVGHPAAQQQEAAEGQRVGVHDPREVRAREVQRPPDRRQRDVDDRGVDHDHELRHREQQQGEVLRAGGVEGGRLGLGLSHSLKADLRFRLGRRCDRVGVVDLRGHEFPIVARSSSSDGPLGRQPRLWARWQSICASISTASVNGPRRCRDCSSGSGRCGRPVRGRR